MITTPRRRGLAVGAAVVAAAAGVAAWRRPRAAPVPPPAVEPLRWVAGDAHLHTEARAQPALGIAEASLGLAEVFEELRANDLEVGALLIWGLRPERTAAHFTGLEHTSGPRVLRVDLEVSGFSGFVDHVIGLGLRDWRAPRRLFSHPLYRWVLDQGGVAGAAHASHWAPDLRSYPDRRTQGPDELPLCLALGQPLALLTEDLGSPAFRTLWYSLLDLGFRVPLAGGSDWPVAGGRAGAVRTYCGLRGPTSYSAWVEAIRQGRTTLAAGPGDQVVPTLQGATCGDALDVAAGAPLTLDVDAAASGPDVAEVLVNGRVVAQAPLRPGRQRLQLPVTLRDSAWVAVRTGRAHSGAVYASVGGRPVRASAEAAAYFLRFVDVLQAQLRDRSFAAGAAGTDLATPEAVEAERREALATYERARPVFRRLLEECRARAAEAGR